MSALFGIGSRRAAYAGLGVLTFIWSSHWIAMKLALASADPVIFNVQRAWVAIAVLFIALVATRSPLAPRAGWRAIAVTGFFQTTVNFGATTMAVAGGGAGRTSVLVFTMPFWALVIARVALHERLRGEQWLAVAFAFAGLVLVVAPWDWQGDLAPRLWATLSGFGWAAGAVATKAHDREVARDPVNFIAWQMLVGMVPLTLLASIVDAAPTRWGPMYIASTIYVGVVTTALAFLVWTAVLRHLPAGLASLSMFAIPPIALVEAMIVFDERLAANEWAGIGAIGVGLAILFAVGWRAARRAPRSPATRVPFDGA
ncbi:MAG: DMT family transporter [Burkholderiales bacterium]|nr:DMT family transporter [Burkholderiales bacterium]